MPVRGMPSRHHAPDPEQEDDGHFEPQVYVDHEEDADEVTEYVDGGIQEPHGDPFYRVAHPPVGLGGAELLDDVFVLVHCLTSFYFAFAIFVRVQPRSSQNRSSGRIHRTILLATVTS